MASSNLGLSGTQIPQQPVAPLSPIQPKSPGVAFLLSLMIPGAGQVYCGAKRRGALTFVFWAICAAGAVVLFASGISGQNADLLGGITLRTGLALYVFAFLDAFFTAREFNDGTLHMKPYNVRLATVLNFTTRGFGYWHLDERKRAIAFFIIVGILDRAARRLTGEVATWAGIAVEILLTALAIDAYRLATRKNNEALAKAPLVPVPLQPESGLNPRVPLALAGLFAVAYVGVATLGVVMPDFEKIDQTAASITEADGGRVYRNPKYGFELRVPAGWQVKNSDPDYVVETEAIEDSCSISLSADSLLPFQTGENYLGEVINAMPQEAPHLKFRGRSTGKLAHLDAHEALFATEADEESAGINLRYVMANSGMSLFYLIIASPQDAESPCIADVEKIRASLVLPK